MIKHIDGFIILPTAYVLISFFVLMVVILALLIAFMRKDDELERLRARHYHKYKRIEELEAYEYITKIKRYGEDIMNSNKKTNVSTDNT